MTRLPGTWELPPDYARWTFQNKPEWGMARVEREAISFRQHWSTMRGRPAVKKDWFKEWKNWCLR